MDRMLWSLLDIFLIQAGALEPAPAG